MQFADSIYQAWATIRANRLRTGITVSIIALGIMALIGIITAIQAMNQSLRESFSTMGANSFTIRYNERRLFLGSGNQSTVSRSQRNPSRRQRRSNQGRFITYQEAVSFKNRFDFPAVASISLRGGSGQTVQYVTEKKAYQTNPNVNLLGGDENYLELNGYKILAGRNLNDIEVSTGRNVIILGDAVIAKCFGGNHARAIGKTVKVDGRPYEVIGTLAPKGASAFLNLDNVAITSFNNVRQHAETVSSFSIGVMVANAQLLEGAVGQATGLFRNIRKLDVRETENFAIDKSDAIAEQFIRLLGGISGSAVVIGLITLIGAAIGLMNIMLVAVSERTREVGLSKAIGATSQDIRRQFLYESIIISLLGACFGILSGILLGNLFALYLNTPFVVPWLWVISGVMICFITGLLAGLYPASKAARLDPIVALRYE